MTTRGTGQGSNSANLRQYNERVILTALRRLGQASKADLARYAHLTDNTAGVIVRDLEARGLIRTEGRRSGYRGQPATLLSLNAAGAISLGAKIGRRSIDVIKIDFCGTVRDARRLERPFPSPQKSVAFVRDAVAELSRCGADVRPAGLGVASPYNLESWHRQLDIPESATDAWKGFDLRASVAEATGLPVVMENDGTAATVAELFQGQGRQLDDFLYVFIGAAVGGGVVLNGSYQRGVTGNAGDIGLMPVGPSTLASAPRPPSGVDVLLTRASINALIRHFRFAGVTVDGRDALVAALEGHPGLVAEWVDDCVDALTVPVLSAVRILDLPTVVIDANLPAPLTRRIIDALAVRLADASPESRTPPELRAGLIGREAAAIGAAILPLHLSFSPSHQILLGQEPGGGRTRT